MIIHSDSYFHEKTCPQCKKKFMCWTDTWTYARTPYGKSKKFFCSYSCLRKYDGEREKERKPRGRKSKNEK